ncbi:MAG: Hpt domain-containing protein [Acidobacteriaceae bacterium]|nr:Hpt domain-containing protein [Acidobacteriaceae bacterium]
MKTLRVLVVNSDAAEAERITERLSGARHIALPASGLEEASEALSVQKFDAVLLGPRLPSDSVSEFKAKLRSLESRQRGATPAPVLSLAPQLPNGAEWCEGEPDIDGYLLDSFQPATLCQAVTSLAQSILRASKSSPDAPSEAAILDLAGFRAQVSDDNDLMQEIIDLFFAECPSQMAEMSDALEAGDLDRLSKVAHTIKGSFAALHAERARRHAQDLETAAKGHGAEECCRRLATLEQDLELLTPQLESARRAAGRH